MTKKPENNVVDEQYLQNILARNNRMNATEKELPVQPAEASQEINDDESVSSGAITQNKRTPKESASSFAQEFLTPYRPSVRQGVYIDREWHTKLSAIVGIVGQRNLTVGNYIDNVLKNHFEQYGDEIKAVCSKQFNKIL